MSDVAETCEALKIALRQTKDGIAVTFLVHPSDLPRGLTLAPIGSRYALAMAEISDDEQLKPTPAARLDPPARNIGSVQRAAILCSDARFQKFLAETNEASWKLMNEGVPKEKAAMLVRSCCGVKSRKEIVPGSVAYDKWNRLVGQFEAWLRT